MDASRRSHGSSRIFTDADGLKSVFNLWKSVASHLWPVEAFFLHGFAPGFLMVSELRIWALWSGLKRSTFVLIRSISKSQASRRKICSLPFTADWHMPEISRFYGIVIQIYYGDHPPPHFHANYAGQVAKIDIDTLALIDGSLPTNGHQRLSAVLPRARVSKMSDKELVLDRVRQLPEDVPLQKIAEEIDLLAAIQRGKQAAADGRTKSHEEAKRLLAEWTAR